MRNYAKAVTGSASSHTMQEAIEFFDDADPAAASVAVASVGLRVPPPATVSVWRRAATVPDGVPEVGWVPERGGGR